MPGLNYPPTSQFGALIDLVSLQQLIFPYFPWTIKVQKANVWSGTNIIARSEPVQGYSHSEARTINLELQFFALTTVQAEVETKVKFLRSFSYPDYGHGSPRPPRTALLILGDWFQMRCVLRDISTDYEGPYTADAAAWPYQCKVGTTWIETAITPFDVNGVRASLDAPLAIGTQSVLVIPSIIAP